MANRRTQKQDIPNLDINDSLPGPRIKSRIPGCFRLSRCVSHYGTEIDMERMDLVRCVVEDWGQLSNCSIAECWRKCFSLPGAKCR